MHTIQISAQHNPHQHPEPRLEWRRSYWHGSFQAMASPCSVLMEGFDQAQASHLLAVAAIEAWRIEHKFSRYVSGNPVDLINRSAGKPVCVDEETVRLLAYADQCYRLSDSCFDITAGVLRRAWRFDGSDRLPEQSKVAELLPLIGWQKVIRNGDELRLPAGMELDFGGIGKEYAVDRCLLMLQQNLEQQQPSSLLVNFGGDLACSGPRQDGSGWRVGVEDHHSTDEAAYAIEVRHGALATSGDSRRYLMRDSIRYGHILDPRSGWPVQQAPQSVTVAAATCTLAGMLATFAMLQGADAEQFLESQGVQYWIQRD